MATVKTAQGTATFVDLQDGTSRVTLQYFYKASSDDSEPSVPQGNFEYDFLNGTLTSSVSTAFDGWTDNPSSLSFSEVLWMVSISVEGINTATFDDGDWNGPIVLSRVGTQPSPAGRYASYRAYSTTSTTAPTATITWATGNVVFGDATNWSLSAPAVAVSTSTVVYWSDLVFTDPLGTAETTEDTGTDVQSLISFNGVVAFTNTTPGSVTLSDPNGGDITVLDPTSVGPNGLTEINGGRIDTNSIKLSSVENSGGAPTGDQSGMVLTDDTIKIQDSNGLPRIILGKLP